MEKPAIFEPDTLGSLPLAAARYLTHAIRPGTTVPQWVQVDFTGAIRLRPNRRWLPFNAREVIELLEGFEFTSRAKLGPLHVTDDERYWGGTADTSIRLLGLIPVSIKRGQDADRAAASRLIVESVWLPSTFLPATGAIWSAEGEILRVRFSVHGESIEAEIAVRPNGELQTVRLNRWSDLTRDGTYASTPYAVRVGAERTFGDCTIPSELEAFWWAGTDREFSFFRATVQRAVFWPT